MFRNYIDTFSSLSVGEVSNLILPAYSDLLMHFYEGGGVVKEQQTWFCPANVCLLMYFYDLYIVS